MHSSLLNDLFGLNWTCELLNLCLSNNPAILLVPRWWKWVTFKQKKVVLELSFIRIPLICENTKPKKLNLFFQVNVSIAMLQGTLWNCGPSCSLKTYPTETKCKICVGLNRACSFKGWHGYSQFCVAKCQLAGPLPISFSFRHYLRVYLKFFILRKGYDSPCGILYKYSYW